MVTSHWHSTSPTIHMMRDKNNTLYPKHLISPSWNESHCNSTADPRHSRPCVRTQTDGCRPVSAASAEPAQCGRCAVPQLPRSAAHAPVSARHQRRGWRRGGPAHYSWSVMTTNYVNSGHDPGAAARNIIIRKNRNLSSFSPHVLLYLKFLFRWRSFLIMTSCICSHGCHGWVSRNFIGGIVSKMRCCSSDWNTRARNVGLNIVLGPIFYNVKIRQGACMHVDCRYPDTSQQTLTIIFKIRSLEFLYCEQNFWVSLSES